MTPAASWLALPLLMGAGVFVGALFLYFLFRVRAYVARKRAARRAPAPPVEALPLPPCEQQTERAFDWEGEFAPAPLVSYGLDAAAQLRVVQLIQGGAA